MVTTLVYFNIALATILIVIGVIGGIGVKEMNQSDSLVSLARMLAVGLVLVGAVLGTVAIAALQAVNSGVCQ